MRKLSRFRLLRGRLWGVCNTPLQSGTCDPSKYRCNSPTGYVRGFKKWICIRHRRWRMVGRMQYVPTTGYVRSFEISMRFPNWVRVALQKTVSFPSLSGPRGGAYAIRPYDRVCAIFRNTDAMPQPGMCDSSKYRCDSPTGYARSFEIPMGSLDWRGGGVWEVGRWGLPLAGETGVNEFGEEEDDDQNNDNKGARGDLQHKRQP